MQFLAHPVPTWEVQDLCRAPRSPRAAREVRRNSALRQARSCYDHLAGVAGVQLLDEMLWRGWVEAQEGSRPCYQLTSQGTQALVARGVDVLCSAKARRAFAYGCLDWTERRPHLGGALGTAILQALGAAGVIQPQRHVRAIALLKPITSWLDEAAGCTNRTGR